MFDPTLPLNNSEMKSAEMRDQFVGLKALIDSTTLAQVLAAGNDANGQQLLNLSFLRVGASDNSVAAEIDTGEGTHVQLQGQGRTLVLATDSLPHHAAALVCTGGGQPLYIICGDGLVFAGAPRMLNLPVADPHVVGALWNDAGTLKVSAG